MTDAGLLAVVTSDREGGLAASEGRVDRAGLEHLLHDLSSRPLGYLEVRRPGQDFPVVTAAFGQGCGVLQCMSGPETMSLLTGDGSVAGPDQVEVLVMDDLAGYTGEYVSEAARTCRLVLDFADGVDWGNLGEWHEL